MVLSQTAGSICEFWVNPVNFSFHVLHPVEIPTGARFILAISHFRIWSQDSQPSDFTAPPRRGGIREPPQPAEPRPSEPRRGGPVGTGESDRSNSRRPRGPRVLRTWLGLEHAQRLLQRDVDAVVHQRAWCFLKLYGSNPLTRSKVTMVSSYSCKIW